jgi:hypothetical protein
MLIPVHDLVHDFDLDLSPGIVHAGAHWAEEARAYYEAGCERVLWIEGDPQHRSELLARLAPFPDQRVAFAILDAEPGRAVTFHRAQSADGSNAGQSSSILPLGTHATVHPEVRYVDEFQAVTETLDEVYARNWYTDGPLPAMVALDIQGGELSALRGAPRLLRDIAAVYSEVNIDELYQGGGLLPDLDNFLAFAGFECVRCVLAGDQRRGGPSWLGWGDGLWVRTAESPRTFADRFPAEAADWFQAPAVLGG